MFESWWGHINQRKYMSKLSDTLKAALDKKKGIHHPEADDAPAATDKKTKKTSTPVMGKKPPTRSAGRGR